MTEILLQSLKTINSFIRLKRALTEEEFLLYQAALRFSASFLKLSEHLAEKEYDECRDSDGNDIPEDS